MFLKHFSRIRWFKDRRGISVLQAGIKLPAPDITSGKTRDHICSRLSRTVRQSLSVPCDTPNAPRDPLGNAIAGSADFGRQQFPISVGVFSPLHEKSFGPRRLSVAAAASREPQLVPFITR